MIMLQKEKKIDVYSENCFKTSNMKSSLIKLLPWCLALCFLCWGAWSNVKWNETNLILFYVEQTNDRIQHKYDSLVKITEMPNIFNHDGILEESHPNRDITGPPTSIRLDSDLKISKNQ